MRKLLESGAVGNIELNAQKKIREDIQKRWTNLGLVEGLDGHVKETVSTLYENQAKHLIYEATASDNSGSFETVVFPLIRRVFSKLLANDIVSVQAMNLPIGKLFFIKPVTSDRQWSDEAFTNNIPNDGAEGRHRGLMGYEREDRNQGGAQNNRFYLPDEVINGNEKWAITSNGIELTYSDTSQEDTKSKPVTYFDNEAKAKEALGKVNTTKNGYVSLPNDKDGLAVEANGIGRVKPEVTQYMKKTLYDLFYNDGLFDNSKGKVHIKVGEVEGISLNQWGEVTTATNTIEEPTTHSVMSVMLKVKGFSNVNKGRLTGPDGNEMDTEAFLASLKVFATAQIGSEANYASFKAGESLHFRVVTQKYGQAIAHYSDICTDNGEILIEVDLSKPALDAADTGHLNGYIGLKHASFKTVDSITTNLKIAWSQYDSLELETEMGEVSFQLTSVTVSVEERKLRATWSPELAQDVSAFHNIDAEAELTAILSEQIGAEIDREILRDLRKAAPWQARWDYYGWQRLAKQSTVYTQKDWNQTLMTKINMISAQIQKSTLRGGANFIVVSAEISAVLNDLEYFHVTDASAESDQYNMGIEKMGALQGRYQVIVDPYSPHESLIMGHHGTSLLDTGYVYAPYIPMALTPTMYNPFNFAPVKGISTRYAKKLVNNKYYGAIVCDGLVHWDINELR